MDPFLSPVYKVKRFLNLLTLVYDTFFFFFVQITVCICMILVAGTSSGTSQSVLVMLGGAYWTLQSGEYHVDSKMRGGTFFLSPSLPPSLFLFLSFLPSSHDQQWFLYSTWSPCGRFNTYTLTSPTHKKHKKMYTLQFMCATCGPVMKRNTTPWTSCLRRRPDSVPLLLGSPVMAAK